MENFGEEDDTHFCIKCHATISGLENYVRHRQAGCYRLRNKEASARGTESAPAPVSYPEIPNADAFFNSLELQSSAKKPPRRIARTRLDRTKKTERSTQGKKKLRRSHVEPEEPSSKSHQLESGKQLNILPVDAELDNPTDHLSIPSLVGFPDIVASSGAKLATTSSSSSMKIMKIETSSGYGAKQETPIESPLENFMESEESAPKSGAPKSREVWLGDTILADLAPGSDAKGIAHSSLSRYEEFDFADDVESEDDSTLDEDLAEDESCSEIDEINDSEYPPRGHTGGKWRPGLDVDVNRTDRDLGELDEADAEPDDDLNLERPPPSHTGGKWKPVETTQNKREDDELKDEKETTHSQPPPGHTRGKWVPGARSDHRVGFHCSPCGRTLASRLVYNRHLLSELHAKRSIRELDGVLRLPRGAEPLASNENRRRKAQATWKVQENEKIGTSDTKKKSRVRKREVIWCEMCRTRVRRSQMGKHLLSHYHCRVGGVVPRSPRARAFLLNNIGNVVRQCPFQCAGCRFYCNTEDTFLLHWRSELHMAAHRAILGSFRCTACDFTCEDNAAMDSHLTSPGHRRAVSAMNGSVPVVITRQRRLPCDTCGQDFRYNLQLRQHLAETGHEAESASDAYQSRLGCPQCSKVFRSAIALQRHQLATHRAKNHPTSPLSQNPKPYFCSVCSSTFPSAEEAVRHRKTPRHKELVQARKNSRDRNEPLRRKCPNCESALSDLTALKEHLLDAHAELCHRCPRCGETFALPQDLALHTRKGECRKETGGDAETRSRNDAKDEESEPRGGRWRCGQCGFATDSQAEFIYHETLHAGGSAAEDDSSVTSVPHCPLCRKSFKKQHYLLRHIRTHTGEEPFPCPRCKTPFATRSKLNLHLPECSGASASGSWDEEAVRHRNYVCFECNDAFYTNHALRQHALRHTGKKFLCGLPGCPTALRTPGELRTHRNRVHDAAATTRTQRCPQCSYQTASNVQLLRHQKQQHGAKPGEEAAEIAEGDVGVERSEKGGGTGAGGFSCPYTDCHFKSKLKSHLRRHLRLHTGSKPYRCAHCSYASNNFENLRKHVISTRIHPGKTIYECTHCENFRTNFSRELKAHLLQDHGDSFKTAELAASHVAAMYRAEPEPLIRQEEDTASLSVSILKRETRI